MSADRLESYRNEDEHLVVYDSRVPCAFVVSDSPVRLSEIR